MELMVVSRFTLKSFQLNLTLNLFQIQTPLLSIKSMMIKYTISCDYSIQNMMITFWILTSRRFRLDWWFPPFQKFIQFLLCCFINIQECMLQPQIACHTFLCLYQPIPFWNWLMETRDMPFYRPLCR